MKKAIEILLSGVLLGIFGLSLGYIIADIAWKYGREKASDQIIICPSAESQIEFIEAAEFYGKQWCKAAGKSEEYCNADWQEFINCVDYPECQFYNWQP